MMPYILFFSLLLAFPTVAGAEKTSDTPLLGIEIGTVPPGVRETYELPPRLGVFIYNVRIGSQADRSDLRPGDVLVEKNGSWIHDPVELSMMLSLNEPDSTVRFSLLRRQNGEIERLSVTISRIPDASPDDVRYWPGFVPLRIPEALLDQIHFDKRAGSLIIGSVQPSSPAAAAGLRGGDIINSIDGEKVTELTDLYHHMNKPGGLSEIRIFRQGKFYLTSLPAREPE